jgi:hypothetical protein
MTAAAASIGNSGVSTETAQATPAGGRDDSAWLPAHAVLPVQDETNATRVAWWQRVAQRLSNSHCPIGPIGWYQ